MEVVIYAFTYIQTTDSSIANFQQTINEYHQNMHKLTNNNINTRANDQLIFYRQSELS